MFIYLLEGTAIVKNCIEVDLFFEILRIFFPEGKNISKDMIIGFTPVREDPIRVVPSIPVKAYEEPELIFSQKIHVLGKKQSVRGHRKAEEAARDLQFFYVIDHVLYKRKIQKRLPTVKPDVDPFAPGNILI